MGLHLTRCGHCSIEGHFQSFDNLPKAWMTLTGPKEKLDSTVISQPAIYVASLAAVEKLRQSEGEVRVFLDEAAIVISRKQYACTVEWKVYGTWPMSSHWCCRRLCKQQMWRQGSALESTPLSPSQEPSSADRRLQIVSLILPGSVCLV